MQRLSGALQILIASILIGSNVEIEADPAGPIPVALLDDIQHHAASIQI